MPAEYQRNELLFNVLESVLRVQPAMETVEALNIKTMRKIIFVAAIIRSNSVYNLACSPEQSKLLWRKRLPVS